jgi:hypothetical protein
MPVAGYWGYEAELCLYDDHNVDGPCVSQLKSSDERVTLSEELERAALNKDRNFLLYSGRNDPSEGIICAGLSHHGVMVVMLSESRQWIVISCESI